MYFEEITIALDLHRAVWGVVLDPSVEIRHRESGSTRHAPFRKVHNHHSSTLRFYVDYNWRSLWIVFTPLVAAGWHPTTEPPQKLVGGPRRPLLLFRRPCQRRRRWYP